jgi:4-diphosphocytidyl-2C-methyl-D-erythritol kinase
MYSLLTSVLKKANRTYHKVLHAYNSILYRDCLNIQMKEHISKRVKHHEQRINDGF